MLSTIFQFVFIVLALIGMMTVMFAASVFCLKKPKELSKWIFTEVINEKNDPAFITFQIPNERWEELNELTKKLEFDTKKDLFNVSLSLLEWSVGEIEKGRLIGSIGETSWTEVTMDWMKSVTPHKSGDVHEPETY